MLVIKIEDDGSRAVCNPIQTSEVIELLNNNQLGIETCIICLCDKELLSISDALSLQERQTNITITMRELITETGIETAVVLNKAENSKQRICSSCINSLSEYYVFSHKCKLTRQALKNIKLINAKNYVDTVENHNREVKTYLEDIFQYCDKDTYNSKPCDDGNMECLNKDCSVFDCNLCETQSSTIEMYEKHLESHMIVNAVNVITSQSKIICYCCLLTTNDCIRVSQQLLQLAEQDTFTEAFTLDSILSDVFQISICKVDSDAFVCNSCIEQLLKSFYFKKLLTNSNNILKKYVDILKENSDINTDNCEILSIYLNEYTMQDNVVSSLIARKLDNEINNKTNNDDFQHEYELIRTTEHEERNDEGSFPHEDVLIPDDIDETKNKCEDCEAVYPSAMDLVFHKLKNTTQRFRCKYCVVRCFNRCNLNLHLKNYHPEKNVSDTTLYPCSKCTIDCFSEKDLNDHMKIHSRTAKHSCRICNDTFVSRSNYLSHVKNHKISAASGNNARDRKCPFCGCYYSKFHIKRHIRTHLPNNFEEKYRIKCEICGASILPKSMFRHRRMHDNKVKCMYCSEFIRKTKFEKHMKRHENDEEGNYSNTQDVIRIRKRNRACPTKVFECSQCEYKTFQKVSLDSHVNKVHLDMRPYTCNICGKNFFSQITLYGHVQIHTGKSEQCEDCGNVFSCKKSLTIHRRIHTGERPYPCEYCDERFLSSTRRLEHHRRKHYKDKYSCEICFKTFGTPSSLRGHVRLIHEKKKKC